MFAQRLSRQEAQDLLHYCMEFGSVAKTKHYRDELAAEKLEDIDAAWVLRMGTVYNEPEHDIRSGKWRYRVEGKTPSDVWLGIVFTFDAEDGAILITAFSVRER